MSCSGVGVHSQHGVAKRAMQTVVASARTMILHQHLLWPEYFDMRLWSFAMHQVMHLHAHFPNKHSLLAPLEMITD